VIAGVATLVWCALLVVDARVSQRLARESLEAMSRVKESTDRRPTVSVARGTPLADLSIPSVHLSAVVLHGSDARTLRLGVGHIENTAWPGESGNVAIAGHRDSFFRPLRNVKVGDDILLETPQGRFHYQVSSLRVVSSNEVSVLNPTEDATLTLVTCYPFWFVGHAQDRFVVRATRVAGPTQAAVATPAWRMPEPGRATVVEHASAPARKFQSPRDDDVLVRLAIEQFRLTLNARLATHGEVRPGGPLRFQACGIIVEGNTATATCDPASDSPDGHEPAWTFTLGRAGGAWAIKSVASD
jgi:sortase A